jgi:hypothetical protein
VSEARDVRMEEHPVHAVFRNAQEHGGERLAVHVQHHRRLAVETPHQLGQ